jgi:GNAT superfamily N-acetyltransferase
MKKLLDLLKEDYSLSLKNVEDVYIVRAITENGEKIGELRFVKSKSKPNLIGTSVVVDPNYRRQGIGSAMYVYAEKKLNMKFIKTNDVLTPDGKALWDNPNRKFGIKH